MDGIFNGMALVMLVLVLLLVGLYSQVYKLKEQQINTLESKILAEEEKNRLLGTQLTEYERDLLIKETQMQVYKQLSATKPIEQINNEVVKEAKNELPWPIIIYGSVFISIGGLVLFRYIKFRQQNYERTINQLLLTKYNGEYYYDFKQKKLIATNQFDEYTPWKEV